MEGESDEGMHLTLVTNEMLKLSDIEHKACEIAGFPIIAATGFNETGGNLLCLLDGKHVVDMEIPHLDWELSIDEFANRYLMPAVHHLGSLRAADISTPEEGESKTDAEAANSLSGFRNIPKREIPVTPEMIAAGVEADAHHTGQSITEEDAIRVYRAMAALAPIVAVAEFSEALAALRQRDEARMECERLQEMLGLTKGWRGVASIGPLRLADGSWGDCVAVSRQDWEDACDGKLAPKPVVPFIKGGTYDPADAERYDCHLIWWPDELHIPFFAGEKGSRTAVMAERQLAAKDERDEAIRARDETRNERDRWIENTKYVMRDRIDLRAQLTARDARIAELDTLLAQRPAPVPDTPKSAPNPFRDFSGDRRRVGR